MSVKVPTGVPFRIDEREQFPGLDLECVPGVYDVKLRESYEADFSRVEYKPCVLPGIGKQLKEDPLYAWFCDRGDWMYALHPEQRNAFVPMAWPSWLKALCEPLRAQISQLGNRLWWNACLITYHPVGHLPTQRSRNDPWIEFHSPVVDVVIIPEGEGWEQATVELQSCSSNAEASGLQFSVESGTALVFRENNACPDKWAHTYVCSDPKRAFYVVSLIGIHPTRVWAQYAAKYPTRTVAGLDSERRIIPAFHFPKSLANAKAPIIYRPEPPQPELDEPEPEPKKRTIKRKKN
jgi:hypothetical protein